MMRVAQLALDEAMDRGLEDLVVHHRPGAGQLLAHQHADVGQAVVGLQREGEVRRAVGRSAAAACGTAQHSNAAHTSRIKVSGLNTQ